MDIVGSVHQNALLRAVREGNYLYYLLAGGFGCGKSFTDVALILMLIGMYQGSFITIGLGGVTQKLLRDTVLQDLFKLLNQAHIPYTHNSQASKITVGTVQITYIAVSVPSNIFAYNFNCMIIDELDELPAERVMEVITACQERTRVVFPDMREPFTVITTTLQGLKGMYTLVENFKEKNIRYWMVRGRTADNPYLSRNFVKSLADLYSEDERQAYLEGKFVNLTTGRVYPEFDESKCSTRYMSVFEDEPIFVGQDFNTGYNAAVVLVDRNGMLYVVEEYHWDVVGDGMRRLRELYPDNPITLIPDASGKEIMQGFAEEADEADINLFWNSSNPSISERILAINKLFRLGKLKVSSECKKLTRGLKTRGFDDNGKPYKGKGVEALDHECDSLEYAVWYILHNIRAFDEILGLLSFMRSNKGE